MMQALCFFFRSAFLALQHGSTVPHEWLAATARSVEYGRQLKQLNYQTEDKCWMDLRIESYNQKPVAFTFLLICIIVAWWLDFGYDDIKHLPFLFSFFLLLFIPSLKKIKLHKPGRRRCVKWIENHYQHHCNHHYIYQRHPRHHHHHYHHCHHHNHNHNKKNILLSPSTSSSPSATCIEYSCQRLKCMPRASCIKSTLSSQKPCKDIPLTKMDTYGWSLPFCTTFS